MNGAHIIPEKAARKRKVKQKKCLRVISKRLTSVIRIKYSCIKQTANFHAETITTHDLKNLSKWQVGSPEGSNYIA